MKLVKEILIYIVFTGVIFGIFTLVTKDKEVVNTASLVAGNHEQMIQDIDRDWKGLSDWSEDTYNRHNTMVAQSLNAGIINDIDSRALKDRINKAAYQKCVAAMNREFDKADCSASKLADNYAGLQTILMNERGLAGNSQIAEVTNLYNLYTKIIAFNNRSVNMGPRFNGSDDSWKSWEGHQDRVMKQKNDFISNALFQRLKNITAIKEIYRTDSKLAEARGKFYDKLSDEIHSYFSKEKEEAQNGSVDESERSSKISGLRNRMTHIRAKMANEKYLNYGHPIFSRLYNQIQEMR